MSLPTISRGFTELFGAAKSKLNDIQKSMASILPAMPGMPVGKFFDLAIGIDIHATTWPPLPVCPVPHIGMVFDLMAAIMSAVASQIPSPPPPPADGSEAPFSLVDAALGLVKGMAPSVKVHNQWVANAGIPIVHLPAFILHLLPVVAPMSESEMWMGSSTVLADGSPCSTQFHPALSCNTVGFPPPPRCGKKGIFKKPLKSLMAPTSMLSIITSGGKPVLVGGPPTIDLFQLLVKIGMKGLCKLWSKTKLSKKLDDLLANTKLGKIQKNVNEFLFGEPVDAATGRVFHENVDFELPGPIPLVWKRTYYSDAEIDGPLGYNWHHSYNTGLYDGDSHFILRLPEGREAALPKLIEGESYFNRKEKLLWKHEDGQYILEDGSGYLYRFGTVRNRQDYAMLSDISTKDGFRIRFHYNSQGNLREMEDSRGQRIFVETDVCGRIIRIYIAETEDEINLVRYRYDESGNMTETMDALNVSKYFVYDGHLLTKLTNQSGMSFHWEYEGKGDESRCIHTWGDGGVLEYRTEYLDGMTRSTNGLGHTTEYYHDADHLIYKIVDSNGGITRNLYNAHQELEVSVNPEGLSTKTEFTGEGKVSRFTNENGETTSYAYDDRGNPVYISSPGGMSASFEYDGFDRIIRRKNATDTFTYHYEGALLKAVTDSQNRRYEFGYNRHNDPEKLTYPNGLFRKWEYDSLGRLTASRDVKGNLTRYRYDRAGNLTCLEEPDGNIHHFAYDASGNMIHVGDSLHEVAFTYGPMGVLKSRTQNGRTVRFGYDTELQLRRIINEGDEAYRFDLDGLGQVIRETGFDGLVREYIRDGAGRVTKVLRPEERWTQYIYDGTGNVVKEEHHDGTWTAYRYNADGLLIEALNENGLVRFKRDKAGRIVEESRGEHGIQRVYDPHGGCTQLKSSLGANIRYDRDEDGNLVKMESESWLTEWQRDSTGLELYRKMSGDVNIRTERDGFGREIRKSIGVRNVEQTSKRYQWGTGNRLQGVYDERTGRHANFDYDAFDNLIRADYREGGKVETIYRAPDAIGNLYETPSRTDRKYDLGGRLLEDPNYNYHYDCEGNLIFKEFKKPQGYRAWGKEAIEKKFGIKFKATGTGWYYGWSAGGMLKRVVNPEKGVINFGYDPLGRRIYKEAKQKRTCWLWDGNVPLHEWTETEREPLIDIVTWVFEDGTFVPTARITDRGSESIVTDYLGTPNVMFDGNGNKTWEADLDIYGRVRTFAGRSLSECPFRYQGQYEDSETGLYYNRFRYYDPDSGNYLSQDPIGLAGNNPTLYGYVHDVNFLIDPFGLLLNPIYTRGTNGEILTGKVTITQADIGTGTATNASSRARARSLGNTTDDAGHIFGRNLGGSGGVEHVFPQDAHINRGLFRDFEDSVAGQVRLHGSVDAHVELIYKNGGTRPTHIQYSITTPDGRTKVTQFNNSH